ncbi:MAG TPA: outer membrane beta-barrel protein [Stellaceae bacterium]|nr:outer membrane beta-barrel protein [Stellaceae bacterium]
MSRSISKTLRLSVAAIALFVVWECGISASSALAQTPAAPPADTTPAAPGTEAPAAPAAPTSPLTAPSMAGPLALSTTPYNFDAAGLGHVYVSGVLSGLGLFQDNSTSVFAPTSGKFLGLDKDNNFDISNGMAVVQKIDGLVQFYVQTGVYSLPALGVNYHDTQRASEATKLYFGPVPEAYLKVAPTDNFSIEAGNLPSLIGDEYTFTFENMNIERGLLWNLEPAISRGVQANYTAGPVAFALSGNDGFFSSDLSWMTGSATWTINPQNTLALAVGGNLDTSKVNSFAAPFQLDNSDVVNLIYTYNNAPWTVSPYFQYTHNKHSTVYNPGTTKDADTWGGAVLATYNINDNWNLSGRIEYVGSSGSSTDGTVNVLFGPGSSAWSFTVTPTWQMGIWFARLEGSYVTASSVNSGDGFGKFGTASDQARLVIEGGVAF